MQRLRSELTDRLLSGFLTSTFLRRNRCKKQIDTADCARPRETRRHNARTKEARVASDIDAIVSVLLANTLLIKCYWGTCRDSDRPRSALVAKLGSRDCALHKEITNDVFTSNSRRDALPVNLVPSFSVCPRSYRHCHCCLIQASSLATISCWALFSYSQKGGALR